MKTKALLLICSCLLAINLQAAVRYVKPDGTTLAENAVDATSWATACNDLQAVINVSEAGDEIWVAAGTYVPNRRPDYIDIVYNTKSRDNAFLLKKDVKVYGSFVGTETMLTERQLPASGNYTSILSGDFNGDDGADFTNRDENAHHVVVSVADVGVACLDGFTITGGNANGISMVSIQVNTSYYWIYRAYGGGIIIQGSSPALSNINVSGNMATGGGGGIDNSSCSSILTNVSISGNTSFGDGGGMRNGNSFPVLNNVSISGNVATGNGGGIHNGASSPVLTNVSINGNQSFGNGGGMSNTSITPSSPILINVSIDGNTATGNGGGIYNDRSSLILTNTSVTRNTAASNGGGMYNYSSSPIMTNSNVNGNTAATSNGNGIHNNYYSSPKIRNSIIWGNGESISDNVYNTSNSDPVYSYSLVEGLTETEGVIFEGEDPIFVDVANGDFRLQAGSPCINAGNNSFFDAGQTPDLSAITADLAGNSRISGGTVDLGAYEYQMHTISGQVMANGSPLAGVTISDGNGTTVVTDATGKYIMPAYYNSTVTLTPSLEGCTFTPANILCSNVTSDLANRDFIATIPLSITPDINGIVYVSPTGAGNKTGDSWSNAAKGLAEALYKAQTNAGIKEIWVMGGIYKPEYEAGNGTTDRDRSFVLVKDVKICGSFAGTETSLEERQLPVSGDYTSILSGDFLDDDGADFTNMEENAYHVVISAGDAGVACIDGFTITGGSAVERYDQRDIIVNTYSISRGSAAGMCNWYSSPVITNVKISGNLATTNNSYYRALVGGICNHYSNSVLTNVIISENKGGIGGMYNTYSNPILTNVSINRNIGDDNNNSAVYNNNCLSPVFTNVSISENVGSGMNNSNSSPVLTNVIISGNTAIRGGGMYNDAYSSPILTNVIICGNMATNDGSGMYNYSTASRSPKIRNSIIWGNGEVSDNNVYNGNSPYAPVYSHSLVEGVTTEFILDGQDPLFVDASNGDFRLQAGSPCINAGNNSFFDAGQTPDLSAIITDLAGNSRISGVTVDLGAYEYQMHTISGQVMANGSPLAGVTISNGNGTTVVTDATGKYIMPAYYNSTVTLTPSLAGGTFTPANILCNNITSDLTDKDFTAEISTHTIGGQIMLNGAPLAGVAISNGSGATVITDVTGKYSMEVLYNTTVTLTPSLAGYIFTPATILCNNVISDLTNKDFTAEISTHTISGQIMVDGAPLAGVAISNGSGATVITDATGKYNMEVFYNTTVTLTPSLAGYIFTPATILCNNVTSDLANRDFIAAILLITPDINGIVYVSPTGAGNKTGDSWSNAAKGLAEALYKAQTNADIKEIWVMGGTYNPEYKAGNGTTDRDRAFVLVRNVKIYGSFAGTETSLEERQLPVSGDYTSILSGDFNGDDEDNFVNNDENAYHVIISAGDVGTACLDGFIIRGGNANEDDHIRINNFYIYRNHGGGMYNLSSSPVLTNVSISGNTGRNDGGGMYNLSSSSSVLTNVNISGNTARNGGGMYNQSSSSPILTNVNISGNTAQDNGGGIYNSSAASPVLTNVNISGNTAQNNGGGMYNYWFSSPVLTNINISGNTARSGGGMYNSSASPVLTNAVINENTATSTAFGAGGGGIFNTDSSSPHLTNVVISKNTGGGMYNDSSSSSPKVRNSIIWGNGTAANNIRNTSNASPVYSHSLVEGVTTGFILDETNPLFVDAANGDFRLQEGSPCINAGDKTLFDVGQTPDLSAITTDLAGNPRISGNNIDLGAYQYQSSILVLSVIVTGADDATTITADGGVLQMLANVLPANATDNSVTWSVTSGTGNATISTSGLLTAIANGTVMVRATANDGSGIYGELEITISGQFVPVSSITVTGTGGATTITTDGGALQMLADVLPANATDNSVTWSVTPGTGNATINTSGLLAATANGTVTVRAMANDGSGIYGELEITISGQFVPVSSITVTGTGGATTITTDGGALQMLADVLPANATDNSVTWSVTLGTGDATISTSGLLTATANGTVMVRATANDGSGVYGELEITISEQITSVKTLQTANKLVVYPNPTDGVVYIETPSNIVPTLKLYTLQGEQILETKSNKVDLSAFDKGMYLLQVNGEMVKILKK